MSILNPHSREELIQYLGGALGEGEKQRVEHHLSGCADCQAYVSFVKDFHHGLTGLAEEEFTSKEFCPDSMTLVLYEAGEVDEETARHLRVHLLFCDACAEQFYALRRLRAPAWTKVVLHAAQSALECVSLLGSGVLLQPESPGVRGPEQQQAPDRLQIEDTVVDPDTQASATVRLLVEAEPKARTVSMLLEIEPLQTEWSASLFAAGEKELAKIPLAAHQTPMGSDLPYGAYQVTIRRGTDPLGSFAIEIQAA